MSRKTWSYFPARHRCGDNCCILAMLCFNLLCFGFIVSMAMFNAVEEELDGRREQNQQQQQQPFLVRLRTLLSRPDNLDVLDNLLSSKQQPADFDIFESLLVSVEGLSPSLVADGTKEDMLLDVVSRWLDDQKPLLKSQEGYSTNKSQVSASTPCLYQYMPLHLSIYIVSVHLPS